jgi:hypothetical protein
MYYLEPELYSISIRIALNQIITLNISLASMENHIGEK